MGLLREMDKSYWSIDQTVSYLANADTLRRAHNLLDGIEVMWRDRIDRIGTILPKPDEGAQR